MGLIITTNELYMRQRFLSLFRLPAPVERLSATGWMNKQLADSGLQAKFTCEQLKKSKSSVKVFYNKDYFSSDLTKPFSLDRSLTKIPAVCVDGDSVGYFPNGLSFSGDRTFFSRIPTGHPMFLSPDERLSSAKKVVYSNSSVFASGGYPASNPMQPYKKQINVGIFSLAGCTFETDYLHYRLFMMDRFNSSIMKHDKFSHLFDHVPKDFVNAKKELDQYNNHQSLSRIRTGFPYLARRESGSFHSSLRTDNAVIFLSDAYFRHQLEDVSLLLTSVNAEATSSGKPALLKATAVGMGFFARVNGQYGIDHVLYPHYLRAFKKLLTENEYPGIAKIEFPTFSELQESQFEAIFDKKTGPIEVSQTSRDVLKFTEAELDRFFPAAINPSDAFSYTGNEWGFGSVESMIGNVSSLRFDQVHITNPLLLKPEHHISVKIKKDFSAEIQDINTSTIKGP